MEVIFLGTGTSQGVPVIDQPEAVVDWDDPRNWRSRSSIHVVMDGWHVQVDAAPELRLQFLRNGITQMDSFILTHAHADHIQGMDDLRRFCNGEEGGALPVYSFPEYLQRIREVYPYAARETPTYKGYPAFSLRPLEETLTVPGGTIRSTSLPHGRFQVAGLIFEEASTGARLAYFTDCSAVPEAAEEMARGSDVVVLDALRHTEHPTHMSVQQAVAAARKIASPRTFFTHMAYHIDHQRDSRLLPEGMGFAYDGLRLTFPQPFRLNR
jgi:phosphoribosyl 1,2-cyclic phosphate phosphodiesterase